MIRRKRLTLGIVALVLVLSNEVQSKETCRHHCQGPFGTYELQYKPGNTYTYDFASDLDLSLPNARGQKSHTQVKATVFLTPQDGCNYVLQLQDFRVVGANAQSYENFDGINKPVSFQYQNGALGSDICAEEDDQSHSLNVKRAVISCLQLDSYGQQTDVFGVCPTESSVQKLDAERTIVRRKRNLNKCDKRENLEQNFMAEALKNRRLLDAMPVLDSRFISDQELNDGIIQHASITENYTYMAAVSPEDNGVKANVKTTLQFTGAIGEMAPDFRSSIMKSIIFDSVPAVVQKQTTNAVIQLLRNFTLDERSLSEDTSRNFMNLIKIMRESNKDDLITVYKYIQNGGFNKYIRKIFIDAMLRTGTSAALTAGLELLSGEELRISEEKLLYMAFSYVRYPTQEVLRMAADLLNTDTVPMEAFLGIGDSIRRYCEQNNGPDDVVNEITTSFARLLSQGEDIQIYVLKALLNAGHLPVDIANRILSMAQNPQGTTHIRSLALDVLSTDACRNEIRNSLLNILQTVEEDSEIRIKAYLAISKCPNLYAAQAIESMINNEPSYQVGGFIASHVKTQRNILATINIQKSFPHDPRRYSFSAEIPHDLTGIRSKSTADVIYSQQSFLPRVIRINTTADVLGSNLNVLDLEIRQENFEKLMEYYYGPTKFNQKFVDSEGSLTLPTVALNLGVKLFGADLVFLNLKDRPYKLMDQMLGKLTRDSTSKLNFDVNVQNNLVLIESQLSYPTSLGFPLRLRVEGSASLQLRVDEQYSRHHFKLGAFPSANVDIVSSIALDAQVIENGVKVISRVHAATGVDFDLQDIATFGQEIKISFPLQQQKVSFSHDIFFNVRELGEPESLKPIHFQHNEGDTDCTKRFADYTGLDLCLKLSAPPPSSNKYLAGNYKAALVLNNTDFSHVSLKYQVDEKHDLHYAAQIIGRRQNTKTGILFDISKIDGIKGKATMIAPGHNASIEARYTYTIHENSVFGEILLDKKRFFGKIGVGIEQIPFGATFTPLVYFAIPGKYGPQYPLNTKGSVTVYQKDNDIKISLNDLQVILQPENNMRIYSVYGNLGQDKLGFFSDLTISDGRTIIQTNEKLRFYKNKVKFTGHLTNNIYPTANIHAFYEFSHKPVLLLSLLEIIHGPDPKSTTNRLVVKNSIAYKEPGQYMEVNTQNHITYPNAKLHAKADYQATSKSTAYSVEFKLGELLFGSNFYAKYKQKDPNDYDVTLAAYDAHNRFGITGSRIIQGDVNTVNHTVFMNKKLYELSGQIFIPKTPDRAHSVELVLKTPELSPVYITGHAYNDPVNDEYSLVVNDVTSKYIDFKFSKALSNNNLKFVVFAGRILSMDMQFNNTGTIGSGSIILETNGNNAINLDLAYTLVDSHLILKTSLYPNFRKQPNHSFSFTTDTNLENFETRNSILVDGTVFFGVNVFYISRGKIMKVGGELSTKGDGFTSMMLNALRNDTNTVYKMSAESRNLISPQHYKALVQLDVLEAFHSRFQSIPWTFGVGLTIKLSDRKEMTAFSLESGINYHRRGIVNCMLDVDYMNWNKLFVNGTFRETGPHKPINFTLKAESVQILFDKVEVNMLTSFYSPTSDRCDVHSEGALIWHDRVTHTLTYKGHANVSYIDGNISASFQNNNDHPVVLSADYLFPYRMKDPSKVNLNIRQNSESIWTTNLTFSENSSQSNLTMRVTYYAFPVTVNLRLVEVEHRIVYDLFGLVDIDGQKYDIVTQVNLSEREPKLNIDLNDGDIGQFLIEFDFTRGAIIKVHNKFSVKRISLLSKTNLTIIGIHNYTFTHELTYPPCRLHDIKIHLSGRPVKHENSFTDVIHYEVSMANENLITGNTNITEYIPKSSIFTFNVTTRVQIQKDPVRNYGISCDLQRDQYQVLAKINHRTLNITIFDKNNLVGLMQTYCEPNKPCLEINALGKDDLSEPNVSVFLLLLDLRFFGSHKIDMKQYISIPFKFNTTTEIIFNDINRYALNALIPFDHTGVVTLQTPHRTLQIAGKYIDQPGQPKVFELFFYPNKFRGTERTYLSFLSDFKESLGKIKLKFGDSSLPRELLMSYVIDVKAGKTQQDVVLDVFQDEKDAILISGLSVQSDLSSGVISEVKSEGLGLHVKYLQSFMAQQYPVPMFEYVYSTMIHVGGQTYLNEVVANMNPVETLLNVTSFNENILTVNTKRRDMVQKTIIDTDVNLIGTSPMYTRLEVKNFNSLNFTAGHKDNTKDAFRYSAKVLGWELARFQVTKGNVPLSNTSLAMKGNRLHYDYRYDANNILQYVLKPARSDLDNSWNFLGILFGTAKSQMQKHWIDLGGKMAQRHIDTDKLFNHYQNQIFVFGNELRRDQVLKDLAPVITDVVLAINGAVKTEAMLGYYILEQYIGSFLENYQQALNTNAILGRDTDVIVYHMLIKLNEILGDNEEAMRNLGVQFFGALEDAVAVAHAIRITLTEAYDQFKDTVIFNKVSDRLNQGPPASESLVRYFQEIMKNLRSRARTPEMIRLLDVVDKYTLKKLKKEYVDDEVALEEFEAALGDVTNFILNSDNGSEIWDAIALLVELSYVEMRTGWDILRRIRVRVQDAKEIIAEELEKMKFPGDFMGVIAQDHIFTFDGTHVTVDGDCTLLLVEDTVDKNFSISATYKGSLTSLTFKGKRDTIRLNSDGTILQPYGGEFKYLTVFNDVTVRSDYGVVLKCDRQLVACTLEVSGYYHAHLQGLLGKANYEKYDDFSLPNGKLASNLQEFVLSYKSGNCGKIQAVVTNAPSHPQCAQLFSQDDFKHCSRRVNSKEYEAACNEGLQLGKTETEDIITQAFAATCEKDGIRLGSQNSSMYNNFIRRRHKM